MDQLTNENKHFLMDQVPTKQHPVIRDFSVI